MACWLSIAEIFNNFGGFWHLVLKCTCYYKCALKIISWTCHDLKHWCEIEDDFIIISVAQVLKCILDLFRIAIFQQPFICIVINIS